MKIHDLIPPEQLKVPDMLMLSVSGYILDVDVFDLVEVRLIVHDAGAWNCLQFQRIFRIKGFRQDFLTKSPLDNQ